MLGWRDDCWRYPLLPPCLPPCLPPSFPPWIPAWPRPSWGARTPAEGCSSSDAAIAGLAEKSLRVAEAIVKDERYNERLRELPEVRVVVPLLPELKLSPHFEELLPSAEDAAANPLGVGLTIRLVPLEDHEHLRRPAAEIAASVDSLDVLINNAGVLKTSTPRTGTRPVVTHGSWLGVVAIARRD